MAKRKRQNKIKAKHAWGIREKIGEFVRQYRPVFTKTFFLLIIVSAIFVGGSAVLSMMRKNVIARRHQAGAMRCRVELTERPAWMPARLERLITAKLMPSGAGFYDADLCRKVHGNARKSPWLGEIRSVSRHRSDSRNAVVKVDANVRQPVTKVLYDGRFFFVDCAGVVLPFEQVPQFATENDHGQLEYYITANEAPSHRRTLRIHYIVIEGIRTLPPATGRRWKTADLQAGLRLVKLINSRRWACEITVVDVRNHDRRLSDMEPELRMYAQQGIGKPTDIRFGRFPCPQGGDWVIPPHRKMQYLDEYVSDHGGRLGGINSFIDLRYDELRISLN